VLETGKKRAEVHGRFQGSFYEDRNYPSGEASAASLGN
jgi:hypothetical protein